MDKLVSLSRLPENGEMEPHYYCGCHKCRRSLFATLEFPTADSLDWYESKEERQGNTSVALGDDRFGGEE